MKLNLGTTKEKDRNYELPKEYVTTKFFELSHKVSHSKYNDVYNGCCPICMEGKSWGRKKRCFYVPENDNIYCHNCGWSSKPYKWIREVSQLSHDDIWQEIRDGSYDYENITPTEAPEIVKVPSLPEDSINLFDPNQVEYYKYDDRVQRAVQYLKSRRLYTAINRPDAFYISLKDFVHKNRLIIPFKDADGQIIFYQSRKLFEWDELGNYISKSGGDKSLAGFDKIDSSISSAFLFEGPIDGFFVKNGLGLGGINKGDTTFTSLQQSQMDSLWQHERIWVLDSQWIDETAMTKTKNLIEMGERVFIWPEKLGRRFKDFNQMCVALKRDEISPEFIQKNSYKGAFARVKLKFVKL